jgi:alpha-L-fucosidase 2
MKNSLFVCLLWLTTNCLAQKQVDLKLWYDHPSGNVWENALPVGNGFQGAMVYGNVVTETIQLNEYTVWSGSPNRNDNPLAPDSLAEIRKLIFAGKQKQAEQIANRTIISKKSQGQMFEPVGELHLVFDGHKNYSNYHRQLDIEKAVAKTSYKVGAVTYTREVLASFPDVVVVLIFTPSKPVSLSFNAFFSTPPPTA